MTDDLCKAAGFAPAISFEARRLQQRAGVRRRRLRGRASSRPKPRNYADVVSLKITEPIARRAIGVAWAKGRYLSASAKLFRDFAAAAKSPSG